MSVTLNLTPDQQAHLQRMDEKFRKEFDAEPRYRAEGLTPETFIAMRRIDEGLAFLQSGTATATAPAQSGNWLASNFDADPILAETGLIIA